MAVILDPQHVKIETIATRWRSERRQITSVNLRNTFVSNGAARLDLRLNLVTTDAAGKNYIEGVVLPAAYMNQPIRFELPREVIGYTGTPASSTIETSNIAFAGASSVILRVGSSGSQRPSASTVYVGMALNFEGDPGVYRVTSYNAATGAAGIFPNLRNTLTLGTDISYQTVSYQGHIVNDPQGTSRPGAFNYVTYSLNLEEDV